MRASELHVLRHPYPAVTANVVVIGVHDIIGVAGVDEAELDDPAVAAAVFGKDAHNEGTHLRATAHGQPSIPSGGFGDLEGELAMLIAEPQRIKQLLARRALGDRVVNFGGGHTTYLSMYASRLSDPPAHTCRNSPEGLPNIIA